MRKLSYLFIFVLTVFLVACTQDPVVESLADQEPTATVLDTETLLAEAEAEVQVALAEIEAEEQAVAKGPAVYVPAESVDALADALAAAGPNGRVVLESGPHYESQTVVIDQRVRLEGEPGAVLYSSVAAAPDLTDIPIPILPALHIKGADRTRIANLDIRAAEGSGNSGILVEAASAVRVMNTSVQGFGFGILLFEADHAQIVNNTVTGVNTTVSKNGIFVIKGKHVRLFNNDISQFDTNIFTSDYGGLAFGNFLHHGNVGVLVCTAPAQYLSPAGETMQAPESSNRWLLFGNNSTDNALAGYTLIDGAFNNRVLHNKASGNGILDIALYPAFQGETMFFPVTHDNLIISTFFPGVTIMDCGDDNTVVGGTTVDCFL